MLVKFFSRVIIFLFFLISYVAAQHWITEVSPEKNSLITETNTKINVKFNRAIDQNSISDSSITIMGSFTGFNDIHSFNYVDLTNTLILNIGSNFLVGEKISVVITEKIMDLSGSYMPSPYSWNFHIKPKLGKSNFIDKSRMSIGRLIKSISIGDLDRDMDLDFLLTESDSNSVLVFSNSGTGNYDFEAAIKISGDVGKIVTGDFNNDRKLDFAVAVNTVWENYVLIFVNLGNMQFSQIDKLSNFRDYISDIITCDFNSDGKLDLAISYYSDVICEFKVAIRKGQGNGKFSYGNSFNTGVYSIEMIAEDFDNSGSIDIAISTPGQGSGGTYGKINIHKNTNNNFVFDLHDKILDGSIFYLSGGTINSDSYVDIIDSNGRIFINDSTGKMNLDTALITIPSYVKDNIIIDLDGDSCLDIVYSDGKIYQNTDFGRFSLINDLEEIGSRLFSGDLNGDSTIDIIGVDNKNLNFLYNQIRTKVDIDNEFYQKSFLLKQNYPNPFNSITTIPFYLPKKERVLIELYDLAGKKINKILDNVYSAGEHEYKYSFQKLASGIYFYKIKVGSFVNSRKLLYLK